jgi:hypothetical protein
MLRGPAVMRHTLVVITDLRAIVAAIPVLILAGTALSIRRAIRHVTILAISTATLGTMLVSVLSSPLLFLLVEVATFILYLPISSVVFHLQSFLSFTRFFSFHPLLIPRCSIWFRCGDSLLPWDLLS